MAQGMLKFFEDILLRRIPKIVPVKAIFVDGDMLDHAIRLYQPSFKAFLDVLIYLFTYCATQKIPLRILNGTWEHDHGQLRYLPTLQAAIAPTCNLKVIDRIDLEYIPELDLRILYIPDDMPYNSSQEIIDVVVEKMRELGWDYVDYACIHGFFDFTVPPVARAAQKIIYEERQFPFVRKGINAGHVHIHQKVGKVISNGNVDNTRFGEVGPKGAVLVVDDTEGGTSSVYLENQFAAPYVTVTYGSEDTTSDITADIARVVSEIKTERIIHLRVLIENKDLRQAIRVYLADTYPHIRCKVAAPPKDASSHVEEERVVFDLNLPPMPTPETLAEYVYNRIASKETGILQDDVTWALQARVK